MKNIRATPVGKENNQIKAKAGMKAYRDTTQGALNNQIQAKAGMQENRLNMENDETLAAIVDPDPDPSADLNDLDSTQLTEKDLMASGKCCKSTKHHPNV